MESAFSILMICSTPLILFLVGALGGFIGGKASSMVLKELNPSLTKDTHSRIVKRSTLGFFLGFLVGGIFMGIGLASAMVTPYVNLSYQWALFVAVGFALMGIIGSTMACSELFGK